MKHSLELLEARIAPAKLFALSSPNELLTFDSATPGTLAATQAITGLVAGETLLGMDVRPATGEIYALGLSTLYIIEPSTATAKVVAALAADPLDTSSPFAGLAGTQFGVDFNPLVDRLRIVSNADLNLRINPENGFVTTDDGLNPGDPNVIGSAYLNNYVGATATTLYGLDSSTDQLIIQTPPNNGTIVPVGALGVDIGEAAHFDIQTVDATSTAYGTFVVGGVTGLYTINLVTGSATLVGAIGNGAVAVRGFTVAAPTVAVTLVNEKTATFTDTDGDLVTVKVSKGTLEQGDFLFPIFQDGQARFGGLRLNNDGAEFDGANISITAKRAAAGDGSVLVGYINARGHDLGTVTVGGDLGRIDAGDTTATTAALKSLTVASLGRGGAPLAGGSLSSNLIGAVPTLTVKTDVNFATINISASGLLAIGKLTVGGSVIGGADTLSGSIFVNGDIGTAKIGQDFRGGTGSSSALLSAIKIGSVTVGGSLIGNGSSTAGISTGGDIGSVKIGRNVQGGAGGNSGFIFSDATIKSVTVGGSLIGGDIGGSGQVIATDGLGAVKIGGSMIGGSGDDSGSIVSSGSIGSVKIGGDVRGGTGEDSAYIHAVGLLGPVSIAGSLIGGSGEASALVYAGNAIATGNVMKGVTVGGSVIGGSGVGSGSIGSALGGVGATVNVNIGPVVIKGSLIGGGLNSASITGNNIAGITIGGDIAGGATANSGHIDATGELKKLTIGGSIFGGIGAASGYANAQKLGSAKIGRDLRGGTGDFSGYLSVNLGGSGAIVIGGNLVSGDGNRSGSIEVNSVLPGLTIGGDIVGSASDPVYVTARGEDGKTTPVALGKLAVKGSVTNTVISAGTFQGTVLNADAGIGSVTVGGDFVSSSIVAGVNAGGDGVFGTGDDAAGAFGHTAGNVSKIASVIIKGQAYGTSGGIDNYGIVAQTIGVVKIGAVSYAPLNASSQGPVSLSVTGDFFARTDV